MNQRRENSCPNPTWFGLQAIFWTTESIWSCTLPPKPDRARNLSHCININFIQYPRTTDLDQNHLYIPEEAGTGLYYDDTQTGFRPGLCPHDSLHLFRNRVGTKRCGTNKVPGLLVGIDHMKALDILKNSAVSEALGECRLGTCINAAK